MVKKRKKNVQKMQFSQETQLFCFTVLLQFSPQKLDFFKNKQNFKYVLWGTFFVSGVY